MIKNLHVVRVSAWCSVAIGFLICLNCLWATTTGKIAGIVTDKESGDPLPSVNIIIEGTELGAATDISGQYFILNIPPGVYDIRASMIGYRKQVVAQIRVSISRTTTVNFSLDQEVLDVGAELFVVAAHEKVRTDVSFTQTAVTAELMDVLPTTPDVREVIALSPGIYRNDQGHIEIRGGNMDEVGVFVDDISMQNQRSGVAVLNLPQNAIQEVQIIRGGYNAEYGQAQSGIINIVTKESRNRYSGSLNVQYGPKQQKHFGPDYFSPDYFWGVGRFLSRDSVWVNLPWLEGNPRFLAFQGWDSWWANTSTEDKVDRYHPTTDFPYGQSVEDAMEIWKWRHRPQDYGDGPDVNVDATLAGPVPFISNKVDFFITGHYNRTLYPFKFYRSDYTEIAGTLKLKYQITPNISLMYQGILSDQAGTSFYSGGVNLADPRYWISTARVMGQIFVEGSTSNMYIGESQTKLNSIRKYNNSLKLMHVLNHSSFYEVQLTHSLTKERFDRDIAYRDLTDIVKVIGGDSLDIAPLEFTSMLEKDFFGPADKLGYFRLGGTANNRSYDFSWNETYTLKADYTNQINTTHQLKLGLWGFKNTMYSDYGARNVGQYLNGEPYPGGMYRAWIDRKIPYYEFAAYAQDKVEFEGMVLNFGLRFDGLRNAEKVFPVWNGIYNGGTYLEESLYALPDSVARKGSTKLYLSPRLGVSHPLSESSKLFFNYGYFYQRPSVNSLFEDQYIPNTQNGIQDLSNAGLEFRKSIQYEIGMENMVKDLFRFTISGYYKDNSNEVSNVDFISLEGQTWGRAYNAAFSDVRGFELDVRLTQKYFISGWLNYDYQTRTSGQYGYETVFEDPNREPRKVEATPEVTRATPQFRANLTLHSPIFEAGTILNRIFSDVLLSGLYQWRAGEWITYHHDVYWPGTDTEDPNNVQWMDWSRLDLKLSKAFYLAGKRLTLSFDVRNLLNKKYFYPGLLSTLDASKDFTLVNVDEYMEEIGRLGLTPGDVENPAVKRVLEQGAYWIYYGEPRLYWFGLEASF